MIKLTLHSEENSRTEAFSQKVVTIGSGSGPIQADFSLLDHDLQPIHVKILQENHRYLVINFANDPFVVLNGLPFGKKEIKNKDVLQIGSHEIILEIGCEDYEPSSLKSEKISEEMEQLELQENPPILVPTILEKKKSSDDEREPGLLNAPSFEKPIALDLSFKNSNSPKHKLQSNENAQSLDTIKNVPDYELGEFDDESENWTTDKNDKNVPYLEIDHSPSQINWKMLGGLTGLAFCFLALIAWIFFSHVTTKNEREELIAAESVADVAMALKYAQIHHIKPQKKNWSDADFIKKSLGQVIPHDYPSLAQIDTQGHLNGTSYSLRIYTNTDFSQFLVIAQPAPSVLQWVIPKTAIVVDSKLMLLKKIVDMKTLNRLLVNSNELDNSNAIEVTNLVKRGELIYLNKLAKNRKGQDFSPPKALSLLRPGAENYIYNAPRYYQLGETIMKRALELMDMPGNAYEMSRLKQDMSLLSKMHDMILYSSDGIQLTLEAQKAIAAFVSNSRFLTAYLKFDSQGLIINSHLVMDDESSHYQPIEQKNEPKLAQTKESLVPTAAEKEISPIIDSQDIHPLVFHINSLRTEREKTLIPLKEKIVSILNEDVTYPVQDFTQRFHELIEEYKEVDLKQKLNMANAIHQLSEEYRLMPLEEFISCTYEAGLKEGCGEILKHVVNMKDQNKELQSYLNSIQDAGTFSELEQIIIHANRWLVIKNFPDFKELQTTQRLINNRVISHIDELLLSSTPSAIVTHHDADQRKSLEQLLHLISEDSEVQTYYLNEFDAQFPQT